METLVFVGEKKRIAEIRGIAINQRPNLALS